ncbi:MAG: type VI secretion system-associated FHA domain protein TagH [Proteobacteria bacterium]|nr:type VI secretion system-associated FHA domain protein TagH [Pseudomonadota bacterium]
MTVPSLTLVAISLDEQPLSQPITAVFDARGGTIGRADHNTMALPDPRRHISRQQAEVHLSGETYMLRNVGAANPIAMGERMLQPGEMAALDASVHSLRIGGYALQVRFGVVAATALRMPPPVTASAAHDPFADLFAPPAGIAPDSGALTPPPPVMAAPPNRLPDDFDPFEPPRPPAASPSPLRDTDPFADLLPAAGSATLDQWFGLAPESASAPGTAATSDPLAAFVQGGSAAATAELPATDPLALFAPPAPRAAVPSPTQSDHVSALHAALTPPRPQAARAAPATPPAVAPTPPVSPLAPTPSLDGAEAAWRAFCAGAGLPADTPGGTPVERLHRAGLLLREAMAGTLQLIAVRASTKHELRAGVTVIQVRENNPLKFSPDASSALAQVLQPPLPGFLDGPQAMTEAMHDLVGHTIGTVAGMRAAADGMLSRFDPPVLEAKLMGGGMLDNLLPMSRKARLWDLYLRHHADIREEAQEDFHNLFGKAFLSAYDQQIERLNQGTPLAP